MNLILPNQQFFESAAKTPTLIVGRRIFKATKDSGSNSPNIFHYLGLNFKLEPSQRTLEDYDKEYLNGLNIDTIIDQHIEKESASLKEEVRNMREALNIYPILYFIENYIFKYLRKIEDTTNSSEESKKHTIDNNKDKIKEILSRKDTLEEKVIAKVRQNNFYILSNHLFKEGMYFILGKRVKRLVESDCQNDIHIIYAKKNYELSSFMHLKDLEKEFYKLIEQQILIEVEEAKKKPKKLELDRQHIQKLNNEEFEEDGFGFLKRDNSYIIFIVCPPHAYIKGNNYYLFEETKIGVAIPFENGRIGNIDTNNRPIILDNSYDHPCLPSQGVDREICFTGGGNSIDARIKLKEDLDKKITKERLQKRKANQQFDDQDEKAYSIYYILKVIGVSDMTDGYAPDANPYRHLEDYPKKTGEEFLKWNERKNKQGFEVRVKRLLT